MGLVVLVAYRLERGKLPGTHQTWCANPISNSVLELESFAEDIVKPANHTLRQLRAIIELQWALTMSRISGLALCTIVCSKGFKKSFWNLK